MRCIVKSMLNGNFLYLEKKWPMKDAFLCWKWRVDNLRRNSAQLNKHDRNLFGEFFLFNSLHSDRFESNAVHERLDFLARFLNYNNYNAWNIMHAAKTFLSWFRTLLRRCRWDHASAWNNLWNDFSAFELVSESAWKQWKRIKTLL